MTYNASEITTLEFPYCAQKRPSMYLGGQSKNDSSPGQKNVAIREILDNSVTEVFKGYGDHVVLTFHDDGFVSVLDNGRGLPVDVDPKTKMNGIIKTMATLHSGGNFNNEEGKNGPGLNGVGGSIVNALSSRFDVIVYRKNCKYSLSFKNGIPGHFDANDDSDLADFEESTQINIEKKFEHEQGTLIRFKLNNEFFANCDNIIVDDIIDRMRYTVYLVPNLKIDIEDNTRKPEDGGGKYHFEDEDGIDGLIKFISTGSPATNGQGKFTKDGIFNVKATGSYDEKYIDISNGKSESKIRKNKIPIEVSFRFNENDNTDIRSFANTIHTINGGVHENALKEALYDTFGKMAMKYSK